VDSQRAPSDPCSCQPKLVWSVLLLAAAMAMAWPLGAAYGMSCSGWTGVFVALGAAALCGAAAALSLVVSVLGQRNSQPVGGVLAGMLVRMAVPMLALLALPKMNPVLLQAGARELLLGFYLVSLAVETWLLVRMTPTSKAGVAKAA
jgi:hypothetical protein